MILQYIIKLLYYIKKHNIYKITLNIYQIKFVFEIFAYKRKSVIFNFILHDAIKINYYIFNFLFFFLYN